jgi:hypothetical protein
VILIITLRDFLNGILRIGGCRPPGSLGDCPNFVRYPGISNGEADNMIAGRESGQLHLILPSATVADCHLHASLTWDRIAPINSQNPTQDIYQNDRSR